MARKRQRAKVRAAATGEPAAFSGYSGANYDAGRAVIWWPDLDTRRELDSFSREEIVRRVRWLYANEGFIRGLIRNAATLVGYQRPQAMSGDKDWNRMAEESFRDSCLTPGVFDHGGKFDFNRAQVMLKQLRYKDGDAFTVLTEAENGRARFAFYEAHQLGNPEKPPTTQTWRDGVLLGPGNRHLAYHFRDPDGKTAGLTVAAKDVIVSGDFDAPGRVRPVPPLAHAVNHAQDITETWGYLKKAIKASSLFAAVREMQANATPRALTGLAGPAGTAATNTDGEKIEISKVWDGAQIPRLAPGESMKILTDSRPSPQVRQFVSDLIRDICVGFGGLHSEVVWEMARLTGPGVRFILDTADRWIKEQQDMDRVWARRVWVYYIAKEIKNGRLPMPEGGRWWAVNFTSQRSLTIDRGKESKSRREEIAEGVGTWSGWDEVDGMWWQDRVDQRVAEVEYAKQACAAAGLDYAEVFGGGAKSPAGAPVETIPPEDDPMEEQEIIQTD
jgi:capsid protein